MSVIACVSRETLPKELCVNYALESLSYKAENELFDYIYTRVLCLALEEFAMYQF